FPLMNRQHDSGCVARTQRLWEVTKMRIPMIVLAVFLSFLLCLQSSARAQEGKRSEPEGADSVAAQESARDVLVKYKKPGRTWRTHMECRVALAKAGPGAVPVLVDALKTGSPDIRAFAAEALGFLADASARAALEEAVEDKDHNVRLNAIRALGRWGRLE